MSTKALPGIELSAERLGGRVLAANDDFFAPKENLLKAAAPIWLEDEYTDRGKWMDGWETRRRREPGNDWCVMRLGLAGVIRAVVVDTAFFRGNFPESFSLDGASVEDDDAAVAPGAVWTPILPATPLSGNTVHRFPVDSPWRFTHLRLNIFPDGGVARFRAYGAAIPDRGLVEQFDGRIDLAGMVNGGEAIAASDMFFSDRNNMLRTGASTHMADGWETKRRRGPGHDWAVVRLGARGTIESAIIDTTHFKGNAPGRAKLEAIDAPGMADDAVLRRDDWRTLLPETPLQPHDAREFNADALVESGSATHVRISIYPDGGVARLRLYGKPTPDGVEALGLTWLNTLPPAELEERLGRCCAAPAWIRALAAGRPYTSRAALDAASEKALAGLDRAEVLEALTRHPRLGERQAAVSGGEVESRWSRREQSGVSAASDDVKVTIGELNAAYEAKFGWIFLLCAAGLSGEQVVAAMKERMTNDKDAEASVAG
ncbi:MAG TPA: allantoicase, partial [Candidatus Eisenbacteria bacterium]